MLDAMTWFDLSCRMMELTFNAAIIGLVITGLTTIPYFVDWRIRKWLRKHATELCDEYEDFVWGER